MADAPKPKTAEVEGYRVREVRGTHRFYNKKAKITLTAEVLARIPTWLGLVVIDLGALQFVGIVDVHRLPFGEKIDGGNGGFAMAVAGLLGAPER
jgi:hypothetical protein